MQEVIAPLEWMQRDAECRVLGVSTSSVDMETEILIQQALSAVMRSRTTSVVASCLRTIKSATRSRAP